MYMTRLEAKEHWAPLTVERESVSIHIIYPERGDLWVILSNHRGTHMIQIDAPIIVSDDLTKHPGAGIEWEALFVGNEPVAIKSEYEKYVSCRRMTQ